MAKKVTLEMIAELIETKLATKEDLETKIGGLETKIDARFDVVEKDLRAIQANLTGQVSSDYALPARVTALELAVDALTKRGKQK